MSDVYVLVRVKNGETKIVTSIYRTQKGAALEMAKLEGRKDEFYHTEKWTLHD